MKTAALLVFFLGFISKSDSQAQEKLVPVLNFTAFEKYLQNNSDTIFVVNFWATWCGPCRRELPAFEKIHLTFAEDKVKVILVSLDFPSQLENGLKTYLKNNHITANVLLLNEPDANSWINKINPEWTGSLPATLIFKGSKKEFFEKELTYIDIFNSIHSFTNL